MRHLGQSISGDVGGVEALLLAGVYSSSVKAAVDLRELLALIVLARGD